VCRRAPRGFETWEEAEEAGRFLNRRQLEPAWRSGEGDALGVPRRELEGLGK
jgi:hypothetical protein